MIRWIVAAAAAALLLPAGAGAQDPPYNIPPPTATQPTITSGPTLPLVAALTLPRGQTLGQVLRQGLRVRLIAYRAIHVSVGGSLAPRLAKRLHVRANGAIPHRTFTFGDPGVYTLRLRVAHRVVVKLRGAMTAKFRLRTALRGAVGNNSTSSVTPIALRR